MGFIDTYHNIDKFVSMYKNNRTLILRTGPFREPIVYVLLKLVHPFTLKTPLSVFVALCYFFI